MSELGPFVAWLAFAWVLFVVGNSLSGLVALAAIVAQLPLDEYIEEVDAQRVRTHGLATLACSPMHDDIRRAAELARAVANVRAVVVRHAAEQRDAEAREHPAARRHPGVHAR